MPERLSAEQQDVRHKDLRKVVWAFIILTLGLAAAAYQISAESRKRSRDDRALFEQEVETQQRNVAQAKFQTYVLCRSTGRTVKQCNTIAKGAVLPGNKVKLREIEAALAKFGEATVNKLFVGPPGNRGTVGPGGTIGPVGPAGSRGAQGPAGKQGPPGVAGAAGKQGPAGPPGPAGVGQTGAQGPRGATGERGATGATGAQGPQGAPGPAGPAGAPGEICPGLRIVTITIPSSGTFKIPICP